MSGSYDKPLPRIDDHNRAFWEGAQRGELRLLKCSDCGSFRYQPFPTCPACGSHSSNWVATSGRGKVWSYGFFHQVYFPSFAADVPYNVVVVELEEGPRIYSNLLDVGHDDIRIGMPVKAAFEKVSDDVTLVKFRPAER